MPNRSLINNDTQVLVVEPDPADMNMLREICHTVGFALKNIWHLSDLEQAIGMLGGVTLHLIILDVVQAPYDRQKLRSPIELLETWNDKKIPVIVVAELPELVTKAARNASRALVIRKPGSTDGEKNQFSEYLQFAMTTAIGRKSARPPVITINSETKILIVEDDTDDKNMFTDICLEVGFARGNITPVGKLVQARGILSRGGVDLVLLDLALDETQDPRPALELLETWDRETKKRNIPVIVVSRHTDVVKQAAQASTLVVIRKPEPTDLGERGLFSDFLQYAIQTALSQRSDGLTFLNRVRQRFELKKTQRTGPKYSRLHKGSRAPDTLPDRGKSESKEIQTRTYETILDLLSHALVMGVSLTVIAVVHWILNGLLGHDFKFFDLIPIRWLIDAGDIAVIIRFLLKLFVSFRKKR